MDQFGGRLLNRVEDGQKVVIVLVLTEAIKLAHARPPRSNLLFEDFEGAASGGLIEAKGHAVSTRTSPPFVIERYVIHFLDPRRE